MIEHKAFHAVSYKANGDGDRVRTGIAAVFGNIDSGKDITHPGAFKKTLSEGRPRWKHLWNHDATQPPIAKVLEIKEIGKADLPEAILQYAPEATGGLWVKREYSKSARAQEVLDGIDDGTIDEMSFAFDIVKSDFTEIDGTQVRNLRELSLFDTSDVNYGMNSATVALAKGYGHQMPLGYIVQQLQMYEEEYKAGRRNNHVDQTLINGLHDISLHLGCDSCAGPKQADEPNDPPKSEQAEAATGTSLEFLRLKTERLRIEAAMTLNNSFGVNT